MSFSFLVQFFYIHVFLLRDPSGSLISYVPALNLVLFLYFSTSLVILNYLKGMVSCGS
jgi:hypothetical protein